MTREEAIRLLDINREHLKNINIIGFEDDIEALDMGIKALEQEPCEDCISRQAVLDCLTASGLKKFDFILDARDKIKKLPPVTPKPKTGHWIDGDRTRWKCSNCGYGVLDWNNTPYCPNCGARMSESKYYAKLSKVFAQGLRHGLQDGFVESEDKE